MTRLLRPVALAMALALAPAAVPRGVEAAPASLRLGFADPETFEHLDSSSRLLALSRVRDAGGSIVRLTVPWDGVAPTAPSSARDARDPSWGGYRWARADELIRDTVATGIEPLVMIHVAPRWAEGSNRPSPSAVLPGTWRPSATALRYFAEAAARRYSGSHPDPARPGATLPRVRFWQGWNEPNIGNYLSPQWVKRGGRFRIASPRIYRTLLNGFYRGIKAVDGSNTVLAAGTAPFGDPRPGGPRTQPALFMRELLCVSGRDRPRRTRCPGGPVRFDALDHHPYSFGPTVPARNPDDVTAPDLRKITRPLAVALKAGNVMPRRPKPFWVTEMSWDSSPPDPDGVPEARQARWLEAVLYVLWRQGVDVVTWWRLRDEARGHGWEFTYQSGVYFRGEALAEDRPKQSLTAFRFPFTAYGRRGVSQLWGLAPRPGARVSIEAEGGGNWVAVKRLKASGNRIYLGTLRVPRGTLLRARQGPDVSLTWEVGRSPFRVRGELE